MAMIIDIAPEVEVKIRSLAARQGVLPVSYLSDFVETNLRKREPNERVMPANEKILLQQINVGLSQAQWKRYHDLLQKRDARNLSEEEYQELLQITGIPAKGRATIERLYLNRTGVVNLRRVLHKVGEHP